MRLKASGKHAANYNVTKRASTCTKPCYLKAPLKYHVIQCIIIHIHMRCTLPVLLLVWNYRAKAKVLQSLLYMHVYIYVWA